MEVKKRQLKLGWRGSCLLLVSYQHIIYCNYKAIIFILIPAAKTTPQKDLNSKQDSAANTNDQTKSDIAPTKSISKDSECMKQESPKNVEIPPAGPAEVKISETSQNSGKTVTAAAVETADQASIPAPAADPAPAPATVPAAPSDPAPAVAEVPATPTPAPVKAPTPAASAQVTPSASVTPPTPSVPPASTAMVSDVTETSVSASEVQTPTISQPSAPVARAGTRRVPPGGHCSGGFW